MRELFGAARYAEALDVARERLRLASAAYGDEHAMTATCLNDVGTFLQVFGQSDDAEKMFEQASRIQRRVLGDTHPHSIATLQNLAGLYEHTGATDRAEAMKALVRMLQMSHQTQAAAT